MLLQYKYMTRSERIVLIADISLSYVRSDNGTYVTESHHIDNGTTDRSIYGH